MSIPWDSVLAGALARTLHRRLRGARTRAIHLDHASRDLYLFLREGVLLARMHPRRGEVRLLPPAEPFAGSRPLPSRVTRVRSLPDERIVLLELRRLRGPGTRTLVLEWMPTRWNALLVEGTIGDPGPRTLRHVLVPREGSDPRLPGLPWNSPPPPRRLGAGSLPDREEWNRRVAEAGSRLLPLLAWTSPLNAPFLDIPGAEERWARWCTLREVGRGEADGTPVVVPTRDGAWTPYPVSLAEARPVEGDLLDAFARAMEDSGGGDEGGLGSIPPERLAALEQRIRTASGRLRGLRRELERVPDPEGLQSRGDLLLARFAEIPRGAGRVTLEDFEGRTVELELDPALPPHANAARFYAEAARIRRARERLPGRIEEARAELEALEALLERVRSGEAERDELPSPLPEAGRHEGGAAGPPPSLPYRSYRSSGGLEIRVGRGARGNDDLTFRHSSPGDVWLHAREAAGAHVVLRWTGPGNPPARDLEEAAILAALHSKGRTSGSVPVDWTFRRHVRKPRKAPPGRVVPERVRTLFVEPDPEVAERLASRAPPG